MRSLVFTLYVSILVNVIYGQKFPVHKKPINVKAVKVLKRGLTAGTAIGASIPAIKDAKEIPHKLISIKSEIEERIHTVDVIHPHDYTQYVNPIGDEWSYSTFIHRIQNHDLYGVSLSQDGLYAVAIENTHTMEIHSDNLHRVVTIPIHIAELIDLLLSSGVNFDIIKS